MFKWIKNLFKINRAIFKSADQTVFITKNGKESYDALVRKCLEEGVPVYGVYNAKTGKYEDKTEDWGNRK